MLNAESFVWHLEGKLNVKALGHTVKDLDLKKDITVSGMYLNSLFFANKQVLLIYIYITLLTIHSLGFSS